MFKITLILKLVWVIIDYFLLSEMAEYTSIELQVSDHADGISLENLPSSLLQGNFLELEKKKKKTGKGVDKS